MEKLPPVEKVYEAWSAIADDRVALYADHAVVMSSDGSREYTVRFSGDTYSSNDNATYWRGYPGYPVIAVLMMQGRLPLDIPMSNLWAGVNWTRLNARFKRDYAAAVSHVETERGISAEEASAAASRVMDALATLPLTLRRGR